MKYLLASLILLVPSCATFTLEWGHEKYGRGGVTITLPSNYAK